jgi:ABC-type multidrug transport system permease subunit
VFNAENIVNPISTTIKPLSTDSKSSMYLIPFLVVLIIMFIGIMLSGTSVLIDKMSSAAFRTFTAPTRDSFYLLSYYLTNVIILLVQIVLIGGLAKYFLNIELMNIPLILLIIFLAATLFIFIGMSFGYIFKSQEGVTIASLSFSALLLFVSNLIIPLESTSSLVQKISTYNPYVILSETLKKVLLYDIKIIDIVSELGIIVLYIILVVVLILIIQKLSKLIYFKKIPHIKKRKNELNPEQYFKLIDGRVLKSKQELLKFLESCDRDEFKEFVDHDMNKFVEWLKNTLKEKKLAKKLKNITNKKEFVNIIEEDVARGFRNKEFMFF